MVSASHPVALQDPLADYYQKKDAMMRGNNAVMPLNPQQQMGTQQQGLMLYAVPGGGTMLPAGMVRNPNPKP